MLSLHYKVWDGCIKITSNLGIEIASISSPVGLTQIRYCGIENNCIAVSRDDGRISLIANNQSLLSDDVTFLSTFQAHNDIASCLGISKIARNIILSCGWDGSVCAWDLHKIVSNNSFPHSHYGHINDISCSSFDSSLFVTVGDDGFARTWDIRQGGGSLIFDLNESGSAVKWDEQDSNYIIVGTSSGELQIFDCRRFSTNTTKSSYDENNFVFKMKKHEDRINRIVFHPKQKDIIVTASNDTSVGIFELNKEIKTNESQRLYDPRNR